MNTKSPEKAQVNATLRVGRRPGGTGGLSASVSPTSGAGAQAGPLESGPRARGRGVIRLLVWGIMAVVMSGEARAASGEQFLPVPEATEVCYVDEDGNMHCGGAGIPDWIPHPDPGPYPEIRFLMNHLGNMEDALAPTLADEGVQANLEVGEPEVLGLTGTSPLVVYDGPAVAGTGTSTASLNPSAGSVDLVMQVTEDAVTRTLEQTVAVTGGVIHFCGTLTSTDGSPPLSGGWTYSPGEGPEEDPGSDPGFHDAVRDMLHVQPDDGRLWGLGTLISFISNIVSMGAGYVLDALAPYTPPVSCSGPLIYNGSGQSCDGVDIACDNKVSEMCMEVGNIPGVRKAFMQCMKGRCGCGGSSHRRLRISCADEDDCGPCRDFGAALGCNIGGSRMWYCAGSADPCECVNVVFHEMSHACGARDQNEESYRIGDWFEEQFRDSYPNECVEQKFDN